MTPSTTEHFVLPFLMNALHKSASVYGNIVVYC